MNAIEKMQQEGTLEYFIESINNGIIQHSCPSEFILEEFYAGLCDPTNCTDCWLRALTKTDY